MKKKNDNEVKKIFDEKQFVMKKMPHTGDKESLDGCG